MADLPEICEMKPVGTGSTKIGSVDAQASQTMSVETESAETTSAAKSAETKSLGMDNNHSDTSQLEDENNYMNDGERDRDVADVRLKTGNTNSNSDETITHSEDLKDKVDESASEEKEQKVQTAVEQSPLEPPPCETIRAIRFKDLSSVTKRSPRAEISKAKRRCLFCNKDVSKCKKQDVSCVTLPTTLSSLLEKAKSAADPVAATVVRKLTACDTVETKLKYHRKCFTTFGNRHLFRDRNSASLAANKPCASREVSQLTKHCSGQNLAAEDASTLRAQVMKRNRLLKQECMINCLPDRLRALKIKGEVESLHRSAQMRFCVLGRSNNVGSLRLITADKQRQAKGYREGRNALKKLLRLSVAQQTFRQKKFKRKLQDDSKSSPSSPPPAASAMTLNHADSDTLGVSSTADQRGAHLGTGPQVSPTPGQLATLTMDSNGSSTSFGVGWIVLDGVDIPFIQRVEGDFLPVRVVEALLLSRLENGSEALKGRQPLPSFFMSDDEVVVLTAGCKNRPSFVEACDRVGGTLTGATDGSLTFTSGEGGDVVVNLQDFVGFYSVVKEACKQSRTQGWLQLQNTVVPFVMRGSKHYVPLSVVQHAARLCLGAKSENCDIEMIDAAELVALNQLCASVGIHFEFKGSSTLISLDSVMTVEPTIHVRILPSSNPLVAAQPLASPPVTRLKHQPPARLPSSTRPLIPSHVDASMPTAMILKPRIRRPRHPKPINNGSSASANLIPGVNPSAVLPAPQVMAAGLSPNCSPVDVSANAGGIPLPQMNLQSVSQVDCKATMDDCLTADASNDASNAEDIQNAKHGHSRCHSASTLMVNTLSSDGTATGGASIATNGDTMSDHFSMPVIGNIVSLAVEGNGVELTDAAAMQDDDLVNSLAAVNGLFNDVDFAFVHGSSPVVTDNLVDKILRNDRTTTTSTQLLNLGLKSSAVDSVTSLKISAVSSLNQQFSGSSSQLSGSVIISSMGATAGDQYSPIVSLTGLGGAVPAAASSGPQPLLNRGMFSIVAPLAMNASPLLSNGMMARPSPMAYNTRPPYQAAFSMGAGTVQPMPVYTSSPRYAGNVRMGSKVRSMPAAHNALHASHAVPTEREVQQCKARIRPVRAFGKCLSCMERGNKQFVLVEAVGRVFFPRTTVDEFARVVANVLHVPQEIPTAAEEKAFISFYALPTARLHYNRMVALDVFEHFMPQLQYIFRNAAASAEKRTVVIDDDDEDVVCLQSTPPKRMRSAENGSTSLAPRSVPSASRARAPDSPRAAPPLLQSRPSTSASAAGPSTGRHGYTGAGSDDVICLD